MAESPITTAAYDVFISYARKDNTSGWVNALHEGILADHRAHSSRPLRIFLDKHDIKDLDDWRHTILGALRSSKILLVCLSPNYFASGPCQWEFEEYIQRQIHHLIGSDSIAQIYFVTVEGSDEQSVARQWHDLLQRKNYTDVRPWFERGPEALRLEEVRQRMAALGVSLWERLQRAQRAESAPGNLRWQNPHFLGRTEELRHLHESLGLGKIGVVTAVQGLGGMGKTELAVAYAHGFADCYPGGLWSLQAEGKKELLPLIGELAWERALGFTPTEAEKNDPALLGRGVLEHLKQRCHATSGEKDPEDPKDQRDGIGPGHSSAPILLSSHQSCLILLDNVSEPDLLSPAQLATLPGGSGAHWLRIVATTRLDIARQKDRLDTLAIDALDEATALQLIEDHQPYRDAAKRIVLDPAQAIPKGVPTFASDTEREAARQIVQALGGFTLAIEQVAIFLGIHPEISPSGFLQQLQDKGLPLADAVVTHDDGAVAAQMLTQSKQLGLILDATLEKLSAPARTALRFAALLPPDTVPWPWLRALTEAQHPELAQKDALGADPWLSVQRRLLGLRLLTPGDDLQLARLHRLVAAHLRDGDTPVSSRDGDTPVSSRDGDTPVSSPTARTGSRQECLNHAAALDTYLGQRADTLYRSQASPAEWELDALIAALPQRLAENTGHSLANDALFLTDKIITYRTLPAAAAFLATVHQLLQQHAASDRANAEWQRDLSVSLNKLGDLAVAQGDLAGALRCFTQSKTIAERLAASDPANAAWQRDLSVSLEKLGNLAVAQGDLAGALRSYTESNAILERLAASDPANAAWQRDLSVSLNKLGDLAVAQGDLAGALRCYTESKTIRERLAASDPANAAWQRDLSVSLGKLGDLAVVQGDLAGALRYFSEAKTIAERLAASDPANAAWQFDLGISNERLGDLAVQQGKLDEALVFHTKRKDIISALAASDPANAAWQRDLSVSLEKLGELAVAQGDLAGALRSFTESKTIRERLAASDPANAAWQRDLFVSLVKLGDLAVAQGDLAGALRCFTESKTIAERLAASDPANAEWQRDLSVSLEKLGNLAVAQGDLAGALRCFTQSKTIRERLAASDPANAEWQRDLAVSFEKLGDVAVKQQDFVNGERYFRERLKIAERLTQSDPMNAGWQRDLAVSHFKLYQFANKKGDQGMATAELHACYQVLHGMHERGLHFDPQMARVYEQLHAAFGGA